MCSSGALLIMNNLLNAKHEVSHTRGTRKLPLAKCIQILAMLVEGSSMRSISRIVGVSINSVTKLLVEAGEACMEHHDATVRDVKAKRVQCDEIWSFCSSKQKNVEAAKRKDLAYGDLWTWTAIDADSKLIVSYMVGGRHSEYAMGLIDDLRQRLASSSPRTATRLTWKPSRARSAATWITRCW